MSWMNQDRTVRAAVMAVGFGAVVMVSASAAKPQPLAPMDTKIYERPNRLVAVEGRRRLNLLCMGSGSPTVVLEAGAGIGAYGWRKVQGEIAKFTRACSYDRAGYGFSDPIAHPADATNAVKDLHALLEHAGITGPVVLVAHSVGGLYSELFSATFPDEVGGMVLVDPTGLDDFRLVLDVISDDERQQQHASFLKRMARYGRCLDLAQRGEPLGPPTSDCLPAPTGDADKDRLLRLQFGQAKYFEALQSEMTGFFPANYPSGAESVITAQVRRHPFTFGQKPLILLTTPGKGPPGERGARLTASTDAEAQQLARSSTRGKLVKVESGHAIQDDHPDVVIGAVREVVAAVRGSPPS